MGYLEEEAVRTYTHLLHDLDAGKLPEWKDTPAPDIARQYWKMVRSTTTNKTTPRRSSDVDQRALLLFRWC